MPHNLRKMRQARGLSQEALGHLIGKDKSIISRLESGRVRLASHHIKALTKALKCRPEDLVADGAPMTDDEREWIEILRDLPPEDTEELMRLALRFRRNSSR